MSNSIEKANHSSYEEIKENKELKDPSKNKVKMFVCEKHVTLWITPNQNRGMMK